VLRFHSLTHFTHDIRYWPLGGIITVNLVVIVIRVVLFAESEEKLKQPQHKAADHQRRW